MKEEILTKDLRQNLKVVMQKEIKTLSKQLEALEPNERLNIIIKLMPFVFPKIETINSLSDEPIQFNL